MKLAIAQINSTIGDFSGNRKRILEASTRSRSEGAELVLLPELSVCGYPPMDLLDHDAFVEENLKSLRWLQHNLPPDIATVVGYVDRSPQAAGKSLQNVAAVLLDGEIAFRQAKRLLPTYDVFDEARYFEPATESAIWRYRKARIGIAICEDIWWEVEPVPGTRYPIDPVHDLLDGGATLILSPSASPYHAEKPAIRAALTRSIGRTGGVPVLYGNAVGGNDSLIFDGYSMVTDSSGELYHLSPGFEEDIAVIDSADLYRNDADSRHTLRIPGADERYGEIERALVLGIRDYLAKTGFSNVHLGLSGGIDSAVVAVLAARAIGPERVTVFLMPSRHSSSGSITDSEALAGNLGVRSATHSGSLEGQSPHGVVQ